MASLLSPTIRRWAMEEGSLKSQSLPPWADSCMASIGATFSARKHIIKSNITAAGGMGGGGEKSQQARLSIILFVCVTVTDGDLVMIRLSNEALSAVGYRIEISCSLTHSPSSSVYREQWSREPHEIIQITDPACATRQKVGCTSLHHAQVQCRRVATSVCSEELVPMQGGERVYATEENPSLLRKESRVQR